MTARRYLFATTGIPPRTLLIVTGLFWMYVTLSNVMYAHSMQIHIMLLTDADVFAPWTQRVVQHLLLFPVVLGCFWLSLRVGWSPLHGVPLQLILGAAFAASTFFAMQLADMLFSHLHLYAQSWDNAPGDDMPEPWGGLWTASFVNFLLTYGFGVVLITGLSLYQQMRDAQLRVSALEQSFSTARLAALRMQLSPHTLFNLLHTIRGQINDEPQVARSMVVQLADLLRRLLSAGQRDFSLLADELEFVRLYLELQRQRFAERLTVILPDGAAQEAVWLPSLILQPLVENAVVHGLSGHEGPVVVRVEVDVDGERLTLRVINTTAPQCLAGSPGIGIGNVRERLAVQFGTQASLSTGSTNETTWVAAITIPSLRQFAPQLGEAAAH